MDKKIKIGVVGLRFGRMTKREIFEGRGGKFFEIAAVCDINKASADEFALEVGAKAYYDIDTMLADADIEAVGLFTPPGGRAKLIRKCIAAGKHIMTTKPFELIPEDAYSVLKEASEKNIAVHLNSPNPVPTAEMQQVEKWRKEYDLGLPVCGNFEVIMDKNEVADGTWYDDPELCPAAPLYRIGIYAVNDMLKMFESKPVAVFCMDSRIRTKRPTSDNAVMTVKFESGAIGTVQSSFCSGDGDEFIGSYTIHYERGTIARGPYSPRDEENALTKYDFTIRYRNKEGESFSDIYRCQSGAEHSGDYEWEIFAKAVRNNAALPDEIPISMVANGVCVIDAMKRSLKSGAVEEITPY